MKETIYFESTIKSDKTKIHLNVTTKSGIEWEVEESWQTDEFGLIQNISLKRCDCFECNYYVDLEIFPIVNEHGCKIEKLIRSRSYEIEFQVYEGEYRNLKDYSLRPISEKIYAIKLVISPILQLLTIFKLPNDESEESNAIAEQPKVKRRKRRKGHLLEGLKSLSEDVHSLLKNGQTADVILYCGKQKQKAHRNVLCARSARFRFVFHIITAEGGSPKNISEFSTSPTLVHKAATNFRSGRPAISYAKKDRESGAKLILNPRPNSDTFCEIILDDMIDLTLFDDFLEFIYTGIYKEYDLQQTLKLHFAAYNYEVHDLRTKCFLSLQSLMNFETAIKVLTVPFESGREELSDLVLEHISINGKEYNLIQILKLYFAAYISEFRDIQKKCELFLQSLINFETIFQILEVAFKSGSVELIGLVLEYISTDDKEYDLQQTLRLYFKACDYEFHDIRTKCLVFLQSRINFEIAIEVLKVAFKCSNEELRVLALEYISIEDKEYDLQQTLDLYFVAYDYGANDIRTKCIFSLKSRMNIETAIEILKGSYNCRSQELRDLALEHISIEDKGYDLQQTLYLYFVAYNYEVHDFRTKCIFSLKSLMNFKTAIAVLKVAYDYENEELRNLALEYISIENKEYDLQQTLNLYYAACDCKAHDFRTKCILSIKLLMNFQTAIEVLKVACKYSNMELRNLALEYISIPNKEYDLQQTLYLYLAACDCKVDYLQTKCILYIKYRMNFQTAIEVLKVAYDYENEELRNLALQYISIDNIEYDLQQTLYLYLAACDCEVHDLRTKCIFSLKSRMNFEIAIEVSKVSYNYRNEELRDLALEYIFQ